LAKITYQVSGKDTARCRAKEKKKHDTCTWLKQVRWEGIWPAVWILFANTAAARVSAFKKVLSEIWGKVCHPFVNDRQARNCLGGGRCDVRHVPSSFPANATH